MEHRLVTVARFQYPFEAQFARGRLEAEDIYCFLADEHTVGIAWIYANAIGGIKLQVREEDAERALEILSEDAEANLDELNEEGGEPSEAVERCPKCGSTDLEDRPYSLRSAFLTILLLGFPVAFRRATVTCRSCGHRWRRR